MSTGPEFCTVTQALQLIGRQSLYMTLMAASHIASYNVRIATLSSSRSYQKQIIVFASFYWLIKILCASSLKDDFVNP